MHAGVVETREDGGPVRRAADTDDDVDPVLDGVHHAGCPFQRHVDLRMACHEARHNRADEGLAEDDRGHDAQLARGFALQIGNGGLRGPCLIQHRTGVVENPAARLFTPTGRLAAGSTLSLNPKAPQLAAE